MNFIRGSVLSLLETELSSEQVLNKDSKCSQNLPICPRHMKRQESLDMRLCQIRTFLEKSCLPYQHFAVRQTLRLSTLAQIYLKQMLRFSKTVVGDSILALAKDNIAEKTINLPGYQIN
ncbi:hypothetical protein [Scytonema sp. NUACC26]|uniref:hypothetical protein n=1 Tax=Scytonema sp. NUACC26 TaxID=3140176 RepID=UPI0034DC9B8A